MKVIEFTFALLGFVAIAGSGLAQEVNRQVEAVDSAVNPAVNADAIDNARRQLAVPNAPKKPKALSIWSSSPTKPPVPLSTWAGHPGAPDGTKPSGEKLRNNQPDESLKNQPEVSLVKNSNGAPGGTHVLKGDDREQNGHSGTSQTKTAMALGTVSDQPDPGMLSPLVPPPAALKYSSPFNSHPFESPGGPFKPKKRTYSFQKNPESNLSIPKPTKPGDVSGPFHQKP